MKGPEQRTPRTHFGARAENSRLMAFVFVDPRFSLYSLRSCQSWRADRPQGVKKERVRDAAEELFSAASMRTLSSGGDGVILPGLRRGRGCKLRYSLQALCCLPSFCRKRGTSPPPPPIPLTGWVRSVSPGEGGGEGHIEKSLQSAE